MAHSESVFSVAVNYFVLGVLLEPVPHPLFAFFMVLVASIKVLGPSLESCLIFVLGDLNGICGG